MLKYTPSVFDTLIVAVPVPVSDGKLTGGSSRVTPHSAILFVVVVSVILTPENTSVQSSYSQSSL